MARKLTTSTVKMAFEEAELRIAIADIQPLKLVSDAAKKTAKYAQIAASIREVGIVEPPVVARDRSERGKYLLLDGHLRIDILKDVGETDVVCLVSTDDEGFTYNKRVNRIAAIQEHRMILKAVERGGVSEERIARALNVDVQSIRRKRHLLDGICAEVAEILKDKHLSIHTFTELKKMLPLRQIEAAELMVAMNKYTATYAKSLLAATPQAQLVECTKPKRVKGLSDAQIGLMEQESVNLEREFKIAEKSYGADHLDLVLAVGYLGKMIGKNADAVIQDGLSVFRLAVRRVIARPWADIEGGVRPGRLRQKLDNGAEPRVALDQNDVPGLERAPEHCRVGRKKRRIPGCRLGQKPQDSGADGFFETIEHELNGSANDSPGKIIPSIKVRSE